MWYLMVQKYNWQVTIMTPFSSDQVRMSINHRNERLSVSHLLMEPYLTLMAASLNRHHPLVVTTKIK